MSLANSSMSSIVKKQYLFKMKAYTWFFFIMIIAQTIGMLAAVFNLGGSSGTSNSVYTVNIYRDSTDQVFILTAACIIGVIINLGSREWKSIDFSFVSNNTTCNISNIGFLITYVAFGAISTALSAAFVRIVKYLFTGGSGILEQGFFITPAELLCSIGATFLYMLLLSSICYFFSILILKSKMFILAILTVIVLLPRTNVFQQLLRFYGQEHSFLMFTIKIIITALLFFTVSVLFSDHMEVGR